ncbi:MAG TPA: helicase-related protein, partial [Flavipsychrobacter sp.]|nr:helicase-related protein [Flavipsychrobacter sp.]
MPRIYDNLKTQLLDGLHVSLHSAIRADFCIGYFNLRGWKFIADEVEKLPGAICSEKEENGDTLQFQRFCRVLIGMQPTAAEMLRQYLNEHEQQAIRQNDIVRLKRKIAEDFRSQLTKGIPTDADEHTLRTLCLQLRSGKVVVKLHLRNRLHAKLYVLHRNDARLPIEAYLGSSNLTYSGLKGQGELNVDVQEHPAPQTLAEWFDDRWNDRFSIDITLELANIIEASWITPRLPYHIYLKMAYHLSGEARMGLLEYDIPRDFEGQLLEFQRQAVKIAAKKLEKRGGVLIGDVVGLGKTVTACALAKMKEVRDGMGCIIVCPATLVEMWERYVRQYDLKADVISLGSVQTRLKQYHDVRQRLLILDESHNLRNAAGSRYGAIRTLIEENGSQVVLLTATPYNKTFLDLSNQLRLFISDDKNLGVAPEAYIRSIGGGEAFALELGDIPPQSLRAFEFSEEPDDWRELMRMYMVRRTRTFIRSIYAKTDPTNGREYLLFPNGDRFYFPTRIAKRAEFPFDPSNVNDPYARLYSTRVVDAINELNLPRYGLALYLDEQRKQSARSDERQIMDNLSRAGKRLMGFCRTNLFKRLESSGWAFLLSITRHILRNEVFLYAIDQNKLVPIGKSYTPLTDDFLEDQDPDEDGAIPLMTNEEDFKKSAAKAYAAYEAEAERFHWLDPKCFTSALKHDLKQDNTLLRNILIESSSWNPAQDRKLGALRLLLTKQHGKEKVLVFSQYADTAKYLEQALQKDIDEMAVATGGSDNLVSLAHRFSPNSNKVKTDRPLRVLIATDVLSEGQNLQDARIIVNYDLPWAIIRLIQRAGRVDRIGQKAEEILCYSFLPEDGIENIIALRGRLRRRMEENAEVVGSDEVFFEDDRTNLTALYTEQSGILDGEEENEGEVDLTSFALGIWKEATDNDPALAKLVQDLPDVVHATQAADEARLKESVIVYCRTAAENDVLAWMEPEGQPVTTSQMNILKAAACTSDTPALPKTDSHYTI